MCSLCDISPSPSAQATLIAALRPLHKLTHLRVVIGASVYVHKEASWPRAPWGEYAHSFRGSRFDFGGTAATLARGLPSLQYVFITTGGFLTSWVVEEDDPEEEGRWELYERWYVSHGWRVAAPGTGASEETGEGPGLVELHEDVAETIIRREELVLSERDETFDLWLSPAPLCTPSRLDGSFVCVLALEHFLPHVARTLENLQIATFTVDPLVIQAGTKASSPPTASLTKYSAVRSLSVGFLEGQPLLEDLQHLFPALDGTLSLGTLDARCKMGTYDHMRAINQRAQEPNGDGSPARPSRPWTRLDRVICSGQMLYVLGLRCPIQLAMLDFNGISNYARYAAVALRENPVPRLKLTLEHDFASGALDEVFSPELARTLTHLTLCLLYSDSEFDREKDEDAASPRDRCENVLDGLVSAIRPLRNLTHLRVVLGVTGYVDEDTLGPSDEDAYSFRASTFDFEGTAAALSRGLPSLENVFIITTTGLFSIWEWQWPDVAIGGRFKPCERWYASRGWRVAMPGTEGVPEGEKGKGIIVELHEDVVETIVRKEELVLSERDEKRLHLNHGWPRSPPPLLPV
ncbi:hypothetical protein GSI_07766 [Ganoderma sinense ZZ0214-1]|uniref:Uncharacterized protein n=1 Tax=Ganoderma sinense ZZ0214-1 TaxID=1077348 RepID=A0A2G8S9D7_9APHY|nr:hypothetical protein GSI_07669 [Ganoderma sinense ZZ0214-1]PIL30188.1 hypothetical protein GSI_07766 [Ganoderma sinense ZZ0214-1]